MGELGSEVDEVSVVNETEAHSDFEDIGIDDMRDENLGSCNSEINVADVSMAGDSDTETPYEAKWNEDDLGVDLRTLEKLEFGGIDADVLEGNAADINENVPSEWESIEGDHDIETDAENVNPNYDPEKNGEWENNCQSCAPAYEMRRRGYDVEAKPFTEENEYLSRNPEAAWDNPDIQATEGNGKADIEHQMQEWGDGSRAEVIVYWKEGGGHAFCAEQVDGETRFIDPQIASNYGASYDVGAYFDHVRDDGSTYYWRTNTSKPSSHIEDCCKEA